MSETQNVTADDSERAPAGIDTSIPHSARMYDYWLGGRTNFAPDRALGDGIEQAIPTIKTMARENRAFLGRATRFLTAEAGVRQFLDIGTGIPTEGNVHEVAHAAAPNAKVVYVDNDPIVLAHARALMAGPGAGETAYVHADLRDAEKILAHPSVVRTLDFNEPVALMLVAILMLMKDEEDPWGMIRPLLDALPSGSYVTITHPTGDFDKAGMDGAVAAATGAGMTLVSRDKAEFSRFFADWEIVEPGVVPVMAWKPETEPTDPFGAYYYGGMARKP